jgi:hypothetical protein
MCRFSIRTGSSAIPRLVIRTAIQMSRIVSYLGLSLCVDINEGEVRVDEDTLIGVEEQHPDEKRSGFVLRAIIALLPGDDVCSRVRPMFCASPR